MQQFQFPVLYLGPKNEKTIPKGAGEVTFKPGPLYDAPYAALTETEARDLIKKNPDLFAFPEGMENLIKGLTVPSENAQESEEDPEPTEDDPQALPADFPGLKALVAAGVATLADLEGKTRDDLIALEGIGATTADRILEALAALEVNDAEG